MDSHSTPISEPDFRLLFESAPGLYLVLNPRLEIAAVSEAYLRATMTRREAILGRHIFDVFPDNPSDVEATGTSNLRASLERVLELRRPDAMAVQKYDVRRPGIEGGEFEERYWSPVNSPVLGAGGALAYIIHRVEDVTEFVRLKQATSASQDPGAISVALGSREGQMEAEVYRRAQEIQDVNARLREFQVGLERHVQQRTADVQRANEELVRQIQERRQAEQALQRSQEQLQQSQKLEAVGRLAGGVAHDFNNLLTIILSYSEALLSDLSLGEMARSDLSEIQLAGRRAADLTRQLLAFSRHQVMDPAILDLNEVLTSINKMLMRVMGEDVELRMAFGHDLGRIHADRGQIEQVVLNLVVNARDAMPRGGVLTISTANGVGMPPRAGGTDAPGDDRAGQPCVVLAVSDTGTGMDAETRERVFEPFFTTKDVGRGTGLGLSTVFGIVKQSGGSIELDSEPGKGATFRIYLPRTSIAHAPARPAGVATGRTLGTESILVVEDEGAVRDVIVRTLRAAGYRCLEARSPRDAIRIAETAGEPVDLLLTNVVMPQMNGRDVADRVAACHPGVRVLYVSGYTEDVILRHGMFESGVVLLQKPFTPETLTRSVRNLLDGESEPVGRAA